MKFSIHVFFGILLWSGLFFLPQGEAQTLRDELRDELREEIKKELREEEKIREEIQEIRQEIRKHVVIPCRRAFFKQNPSIMSGDNVMKKLFKEMEDGVLKHVKDAPEDIRLAHYFLVRRVCKKQFGSQ